MHLPSCLPQTIVEWYTSPEADSTPTAKSTVHLIRVQVEFNHARQLVE
jgi:hypothetical protein